MNTFSNISHLKAPPTVKGFAASYSVITNNASTNKDGDQKKLLNNTIDNFNALPSAQESALELTNRILDEDRDSFTVHTKDISLRDDMSFQLPEGDCPITELGFSGLLKIIAPSGAINYLRSVDVDLRAHNIRRLLEQADTVLQIRTRGAIGAERQIYGICKEDYPSINSVDVLSKIIEHTPSDSRGVYTYNPNSTHINFKELIMDDIDVDTYIHSPEDLFQIGRSWALKDDGRSGINMSLLAFRQLCSNMIMLSADKYVKRLRHRGTDDNMRKRLDRIFTNTSDFLKVFSETWLKARQAEFSVHTNPSLEEVKTIYGWLLNKKIIKVLGDKDSMATKFAENWAKENGNTIADLINGITRTARNYSITNTNPFGNVQLEEEASKLLNLTTSDLYAIKRL